jgi:hypothetical protein
MKRCADCGITKPFVDFPRNRGMADRHGIYCKPCFAIRGRASYCRPRAAMGKTVRSPILVASGMERCPECEEVKALGEFPRNRSAHDGRGGYCKPCHNAKGKVTYTRLYGGTRHYHLQRRYGISATKVDELITEQGGHCAICRDGKAEHVDHEHLTGRVRGILCFNCNGGLGQFKDNPDVLKRAVAYLEEHAWRTLVAPGVYRLSS